MYGSRRRLSIAGGRELQVQPGEAPEDPSPFVGEAARIRRAVVRRDGRRRARRAVARGQTLDPDWKIDQDGWVIRVDGRPT
jgi:hypothetical protein